MTQRTDPVVGIDLGTTNSLVAYADARGPRVLAEAAGEARILPSVVRLSPDGGRPEAIGTEARTHAVEFPERTIHSVKRLMGRGLEDIDPSVRRNLPYELVQGENATARVRVGEHVYSPPQISGMILARLKAVASEALGCEVRRAVVTVPAYFDDAQRQATRDAGRLAGLEVVRIVNEPTAAALAYGIGVGVGTIEPADSAGAPEAGSGSARRPDGSISLSTKFNASACESAHAWGEAAPKASRARPAGDRAGQTVAVYDLGGGTFDVSILRVRQTEAGTIDRVLATAGDTHLGGDDVDRMIIELIQNEIREQFGTAEGSEPGDISFPPATRQAFRNLAEATKIRLSEEREAHIEVDLPPAADGSPRRYRRTLTREAFEAMIVPWIDRTLDCCRRCLRSADVGVEQIDRVVLVGGSTRIPRVREAVGELFATDPYTALNPDEVVALGAAVQASILAGDHKDTLLLDVIPLSLGIETMGGAVAKLITANTTIPARATEMFTTYADNQTAVQINVYQGERELVEDCRLLGRFELRGIPPMPAGLAKVEVSFLVDANGVLTVDAVEQRSEMRARTQVVPHHGLSREEVERMERESLEHADEDMSAHRLIDLRNQARLSLRAIDRQLAKVGDRLEPDYREEVTQKVEALRAIAAEPQPQAEAFHQALRDAEQSSRRLAEVAITAVLQEQNPQPNPKRAQGQDQAQPASRG